MLFALLMNDVKMMDQWVACMRESLSTRGGKTRNACLLFTLHSKVPLKPILVDENSMWPAYQAFKFILKAFTVFWCCGHFSILWEFFQLSAMSQHVWVLLFQVARQQSNNNLWFALCCSSFDWCQTTVTQARSLNLSFIILLFFFFFKLPLTSCFIEFRSNPGAHFGTAALTVEAVCAS